VPKSSPVCPRLPVRPFSLLSCVENKMTPDRFASNDEVICFRQAVTTWRLCFRCALWLRVRLMVRNRRAVVTDAFQEGEKVTLSY
jgi:hypothetical protein